jgi:hypothetical protein
VHHNGGKSFDLPTRSDHAYETRLSLGKQLWNTLTREGQSVKGIPMYKAGLLTVRGITGNELGDLGSEIDRLRR